MGQVALYSSPKEVVYLVPGVELPLCQHPSFLLIFKARYENSVPSRNSSGSRLQDGRFIIGGLVAPAAHRVGFHPVRALAEDLVQQPVRAGQQGGEAEDQRGGNFSERGSGDSAGWRGAFGAAR